MFCKRKRSMSLSLKATMQKSGLECATSNWRVGAWTKPCGRDNRWGSNCLIAAEQAHRCHTHNTNRHHVQRMLNIKWNNVNWIIQLWQIWTITLTDFQLRWFIVEIIIGHTTVRPDWSLVAIRLGAPYSRRWSDRRLDCNGRSEPFSVAWSCCLVSLAYFNSIGKAQGDSWFRRESPTHTKCRPALYHSIGHGRLPGW